MPAKPIIRTYETWSAYVDAATAKNPYTDADRSSASGSVSFTGSASLPEFAETARNGGWTTPQDRELTEAIVSRVASMVAIPTYRVTDDPAMAETFDVGALVSGSPDYWIEPEAQTFTRGRGNVVRIVSSITASAGIKHDVMIRRGATALAIAEALELAGVPTEIWIVDTRSVSRYDPPIVEWRACIKPAGLPIDHERTLIALAHPSTLRRLAFGINERDPERRVRQITKQSYGSVAAPTMAADLTIPQIMFREPSPFDTDARATAWALGTLARYGVLDADAA